MTNNIQTKLIERKWMRAAKAWRCFFDLPTDQILAAGLTALIDSKVKICIKTLDGISVEIDPAFVVDVPCKGKKYQLVAETCFEYQCHIGPKLTAMIDEQVKLDILPVGTQQKSEPARGTISEESLRGLHATFFKNTKFMEFIAAKVVAHIETEQQCKTEYKKLMGVESCKEINQQAHNDLVNEFNNWRN